MRTVGLADEGHVTSSIETPVTRPRFSKISTSRQSGAGDEKSCVKLSQAHPSPMIGRPLFFFCDANTLVYDTHLLAKKGGPEVVHLLRALRAQIALPDVSRAEYLSNYAKVASSTHEDAEVVLSKLETLSGQRVTAALPQAKFWESFGPRILDGLNDITFEIVASADLKAAALDRAIEGRKPAMKANQDIKDCLIWECLLSLPAGSELVFASRDMRAFYRDGKFDETLVKEAKDRDLIITPVDCGAQNLHAAVSVLKDRVASAKALQPVDLRLGDEADEPAAGGDMGHVVAPVLPDGIKQNVPDVPAVAAPPGETLDVVAPARDFFRLLEERALGFISYLGRAGKQEAIGLLVQSGAAVDAARNVLERLALAGMIRDTGSNYLRVDGAHAQRAAELVEEEMIKLTGFGG